MKMPWLLSGPICQRNMEKLLERIRSLCDGYGRKVRICRCSICRLGHSRIRGQAAMLARGSWPAGFDPYKFNNEVRSVITSHGGTFIDTFDDLRKVPNLERYYYAIDNHPTLWKD